MIRNNEKKYKRENNKRKSQIITVIILTAVLIFICIMIIKSMAEDSNLKSQSYAIQYTPSCTQVSQPVQETAVIIASITAESQNSNTVLPIETPIKETKTITVNETIQGGENTLKIDLEVVTHESEQFGIYDATPIDIDVDEAVEYIFPGMSKKDLIHGYDSEFMRNRNNITDANYRDNMLFYRDDDTQEAIMYDPHNQSMIFLYTINKKDVVIDPCGQGHLLRRDQEYLNPDKDLNEEAIDMSNEFLSEILKDEFVDNFFLGYSGLKNTIVDDYHTGAATQVYLTVYQRLIEDVPILFDSRESKGGYYSEPLIDELEVWVNDGKILFSMGAIRHLELREKADIISPEKVINILKSNVDVVESKGTHNITRFELMYYPVATDNADSSDIRGELMNAAYVKYIPVWVIASGERYRLCGTKVSNEYVMIIDAVKGEVIGRRKDRR